MKSLLIACLTILPLCAGNLSGRRAPSFALPDSQVRYHDILDLRGKVVLLEFMTTGCPHCQVLAGTLEKVKAQYGDKIAILHVVNPPDNTQTVANFITKTRTSSPILFDCGQATAVYLKVTPQNPSIDMPHLFFIDPQGQIRDDYGSTKASDLTVAQISALIDKLQTGAPAAAPAKAPAAAPAKAPAAAPAKK